MLLKQKHKKNWIKNFNNIIKVHSLSSGKVAVTPILKSVSSQFSPFAFHSLNYSFAARLQDNSRPKLPTKVETRQNYSNLLSLVG